MEEVYKIELTLAEIYELKDILQYDNLLIQPSGNMEKLYIGNVIRDKINELIQEIEDARLI